MSAAEAMIRNLMGLPVSGDPSGTAVRFGSSGGDRGAHLHADVRYDLFGPDGGKQTLAGREAVLAFIGECAGALEDRTDTVLAIRSIGDQCVLLHARAYRKARATGEEAHYEWAMLYRIEQGLITHAADMLDLNAQAFWGRVHGSDQS